MIRFYRKNNIKYVQGYGIDIKKYFFAIILTPKSNDKFRIIFLEKRSKCKSQKIKYFDTFLLFIFHLLQNSSQHGFTNAQLQMNKIEYLKSEHFSFHQCGQMSFSVLLTHEYNVHKGGTRNEKKYRVRPFSLLSKCVEMFFEGALQTFFH